MPAFAIGLVVVAAAVHAGWNLFAKQTGGDARFALLVGIAMTAVWCPVGAGFAVRDVPAYGGLQWGLIAASAALHVAYFLTLLRGYRLGDLSIVYPVARGTGPVVTAVVASVLLGESLGWLGWTGVLGVAAGIGLLAGAPALGGRVAPERVRLGVAYGAITGVFIAGYTVVDGYAVKHAGISPILADWLGNLFRLPLTALVVWLVPGEALAAVARRSWRPALLIGAVSPISYVLVLYAATMAPLSRVAPARELSMVFAAAASGRLLGERDTGLRLIGAALTAAGVVALAAAR